MLIHQSYLCLLLSLSNFITLKVAVEQIIVIYVSAKYIHGMQQIITLWVLNSFANLKFLHSLSDYNV